MENSADISAVTGAGLAVAIVKPGDSIARWTENGELYDYAVPGLSLCRREEPTVPVSGVYEPSVCQMVQAAKRVLLGDSTYVKMPIST